MKNQQNSSATLVTLTCHNLFSNLYILMMFMHLKLSRAVRSHWVVIIICCFTVTSDSFAWAVRISACMATAVWYTAAVDMAAMTTMNCDSQKSCDLSQECELLNRFRVSEVWLWLVSQGLGLSRARVGGWMNGRRGGLPINDLFGGG